MGRKTIAIPTLSILPLTLFWPLAININSTNMQVDALSQSNSVYEDKVNDYDFFVNNPSISITMDNVQLLSNRMFENLINCFDQEPVLLGEEVSYFDFFKNARTSPNYKNFTQAMSSYPPKYAHSLLNIIALLPLDEIQDFEKEFVLSQLSQGNVTSQEYALNTLSLWNDRELINRASTIKMKNPFLQRRLNTIAKI